jgi:hypothetical protein
MTVREILLWVVISVALISTMIVCLRHPNQPVALRFLFIRYEGNLVGLWPALLLALGIVLVLGMAAT